MQKGVSAVADKFRLMMDNNAKSKEEIQEELHRMIELKNQPVDPVETSHEQLDPAVREKVSEAVKRSIQNKISSIVNEAIKTAEEDERYYGEKIPPRPPRENLDYLTGKPVEQQPERLQPDELAYAPSTHETDDEGADIRAKITEMRYLSHTFYTGFMLKKNAGETLIKQGEFMKDVTDNFGWNCFCNIDRPIYGAMSTDQLRTYFTWRTAARNGVYSQTDKPYIILYCYELLNKIGVMSSADAYNRLSDVWEGCRGFCPALDTVLPRWLKDFRAYNDIGGVAACPAESALDTRPPDDLDILECRYSGKLEYLMGISSYNLRGSIFLTDETRPLMEGALESALTALDGYFKKSGVTMFELLCGKLRKDFFWSPFNGAYVDISRMDGFHNLRISPTEQYTTKRGEPCLETFEPSPYRSFVGWILKSVESVLRKRTGFRYGISPNITPVLNDFLNRDKLVRAADAPEFSELIPNAVNAWCDENGVFPPKKQAKKRSCYNYDEVPAEAPSAPQKPVKIEIDVSKLSQIREESDETTRKLIVEEADTVTPEELTDRISSISEDDFDEQTAGFAESYGNPDTAESTAPAPQKDVPGNFTELPDGWREFAQSLTRDDIALLKAVRDGCGEALCRSRSVMPETEYDRINALAMEYIGDVLIENGGILEDYLSDIQPILDKSDI